MACQDGVQEEALAEILVEPGRPDKRVVQAGVGHHLLAALRFFLPFAREQNGFLYTGFFRGFCEACDCFYGAGNRQVRVVNDIHFVHSRQGSWPGRRMVPVKCRVMATGAYAYVLMVLGEAFHNFAAGFSGSADYQYITLRCHF